MAGSKTAFCTIFTMWTVRRASAVAALVLVSLVPAVAQAELPAHEHNMGGGHHHAGSGGGNAATTAGARRIKVIARNFAFDPDEITIEAGEKVTIALGSRDVFHDFVVKGKGHIVGADGGKTKKGGLRIKQVGTRKFWCSVPGHRAAGMVGTITVEPRGATTPTD